MYIVNPYSEWRKSGRGGWKNSSTRLTLALHHQSPVYTKKYEFIIFEMHLLACSLHEICSASKIDSIFLRRKFTPLTCPLNAVPFCLAPLQYISHVTHRGAEHQCTLPWRCSAHAERDEGGPRDENFRFTSSTRWRAINRRERANVYAIIITVGQLSPSTPPFSKALLAR